MEVPKISVIKCETYVCIVHMNEPIKYNALQPILSK